MIIESVKRISKYEAIKEARAFYLKMEKMLKLPHKPFLIHSAKKSSSFAHKKRRYEIGFFRKGQGLYVVRINSIKLT